MERVVGPALVFALDVKRAAELGRLKVDVVQPKELRDPVEESLRRLLPAPVT